MLEASVRLAVTQNKKPHEPHHHNFGLLNSNLLTQVNFKIKHDQTSDLRPQTIGSARHFSVLFLLRLRSQLLKNTKLCAKGSQVLFA